jgi:uncharacterized protein HemX
MEISLLNSTTTTIVVVIAIILVLVLGVYFWKKGYLNKMKKALPSLISAGKAIRRKHLEKLVEAEKKIKAKQAEIHEDEQSLNELTKQQNEEKTDENISVSDFIKRNS